MRCLCVRSFQLSEFDYNYSNSKNELISCGIHPWEINDVDKNHHKQTILKIIENNKVDFLGEAGLDKIIDVNFDLQLELFKFQLDLSEKYKIPIFIHSVKSFNELIELRKVYKNSVWIIHGYNGNIDITNKLVNNNTFFSFGIAMLNNKKIIKTIKHIPLDHIFLESDSKDINISDLYSKLSEIKNIDLNVLINKIKLNFQNVLSKNLY